MSGENLSLDPQTPDTGAAESPEAGQAAGSDPAGQESGEQTETQPQEGEVQQDQGGEPGAEETGGEEGEAAPAAAPELPEGFNSVEELVEAFREQQVRLGQVQQPAAQPKEEAPTPPVRSHFDNWDEKQWVKGMSERPLETIGEAAIEYLEKSGAGNDIIQNAEKRAFDAVMKRLAPALNALQPLMVKGVCDQLDRQYPGTFGEYRKQVEAIVEKTGDHPETVFLRLVSKNLKKVGTKVQQASGVLKTQARAAGVAQTGGTKPASAAKPPAKPSPDAFDRLIGTPPRKKFSVG